MPPKTFVPDPEFFSDPDGICSLAMAKKAGIRYSSPPDGTELIPLVVSGSPPAPSKVKSMFGHQVTKANAKHHGDSTQYYSSAADLQSRLKVETLSLNSPGIATIEFDIARLHRLRSIEIGGLFLMASHWDVDSSSFGEPVIQVLANPAVATLGSFSPSDRPGINLGDAWDLTSTPFDQMPVADTTCPLLAMSSGFSRDGTDLTLAHYLSSTAPLFIPNGEDIASTVSVAQQAPILRAFYLPAAASLPVGMFWKATAALTRTHMIKSIKALSPSAISPYAPFIHVLESLGSSLDLWLQCAILKPADFSCKVFGFDTIEGQFPSLVTGAVPDTILCSTTFAPLMDMRYLYAWRILVDSILSGTSRQAIEFFRLFLSRAGQCLHSETYIGVELRPELTPNMGVHFRPRGGFPILPDPFVDFARGEVSSQIAQTYDCIDIEIHADHLAPADDVKLITVSEASARRHYALTPRTSLVPAERIGADPVQLALEARLAARFMQTLGVSPPTPSRRPGAPSTSLLTTPLGSRANPINASTPSGTNLFGTAIYSPPDQRNALNRSSSSLSAIPQAQSLAIIPIAPKWSEILTWNLTTPSTRNACAPEYLALCLLLIHGPADMDINLATYRIQTPLDQLTGNRLLARSPCAHFCTRMILPIYAGAGASMIDPARAYIQGMIDQIGEGYFTQFFTTSFFKAAVVKMLMQPGSWRMDKSFEPSDGDEFSFHVYNLIPCLRQFKAHPALLPAEGFTFLDLKPMALFIFTWFRSMDIDVGFAIARFDRSILGCRLRYLKDLLDRHQVQHLWARNARVMTYVWFQSLQSLLYIFQRLASASLWKAGAGFLHEPPHVHVDPYDSDGNHCLKTLQDYDANLIQQWGSESLRSIDAFYRVSSVPESHFIQVPVPRLPAIPAGSASSGSSSTTQSRAGRKRSAPPPAPDFIAVQPLFELVNPPLDEKMCYQQFMRAPPNGTKMPLLIHPEGRSSLICFTSASGPPFNTCNRANCLREQKRTTRNPNFRNRPEGPPPFCHVDLAQTYWAGQPESFWKPVVTWLRYPGVSDKIKPSEFLKAKTPSTPW